MKNADMPAMPVCSGSETGVYNGVSYTKNFLDSAGLTKREMFAIHAMVGVMQDINFCQSHDEFDVAVIAVKQADALLAELERTK